MTITTARTRTDGNRKKAGGMAALYIAVAILTAAPSTTRSPKLPPAWFKHAFWRVHRVLNRLSGGRLLWTPASKRGWGALHLTTVGRKSGKERSVIIGYLEDGPNLVALAMNGWDEGLPAWWLNLEAHPDAVVRLARQDHRRVHTRLATGEERQRLWQRWIEIEPDDDFYAGPRSIQTPVVVFEPWDATASSSGPEESLT
jgi:deazaflavin-dependent oxidoreductase (nitroreductase family)